MKSYLDWLDKDGFYIKQAWSIEKNEWIEGFGNKLQLFPHQRRILGHCFTPNEDGSFPYSTVVYSTIKKSGKALWISTELPTPSGWTMIGDIKVGDVVFGDDGSPCNVTYVTEEMTDHDCFLVTFSTGEEIIADGGHLWFVSSRFAFDGSLSVKSSDYRGIISTREMSKKVKTGWSYDCCNYSIRLSKPLELPTSNFLIPPYTFGAWLGDGASAGQRITIGEGDEEILRQMEKEGVASFEMCHKDRTPTYRLGPASSHHYKDGDSGSILIYLRTIGVLFDKHIPTEYLRSSRVQRLELLRGLMDTDGYVSKKGHCEFTSCRKKLAYDVRDLLFSLGYKVNVLEENATLYGRVVGKKYRLHFMAYKDEPVFHLQRKINRLIFRKRDTERSELIRIVSIKPIGSVPVRCIQVDSPSHLYLIGRSLIPTHNTTVEASLATWYAQEVPGSEIYLVANDLEQAQQRAFEDITHHLIHSNLGAPTAKVARFDNGSFIQTLAQHYSSAAGSRPSLVMYDELWAYVSERSRRMWAEMTLSPTVPNAMRVIVTYAGYEDESDLLYDIYKKAFVNGQVVPELADIVDDNDDPICKVNGRTFVMWDTVPRMPWQTPEYYEGEMANLRPSDFLRMHKNRWVTSNESFIPVALWDRAAGKIEGPLTLLKDLPAHTLPITIGVDIGAKHDSSAIVGVYYDSKRNKVGLAFHAIWVPIQGETLDIENTVEAELIQMWKKFKLIGVLFDPSQFLRSGVSLRRRGLPMIEFPQTEGNMTLATGAFYDLLTTRNFEAYLADDLRDHVRFSTVRTTPRGYRLTKGSNSKKIDAAVALAMACYYAVKVGGIDLSLPVVLVNPFSDMSSMRVPSINNPSEMKLPPALRT